MATTKAHERCSMHERSLSFTRSSSQDEIANVNFYDYIGTRSIKYKTYCLTNQRERKFTKIS